MLVRLFKGKIQHKGQVHVLNWLPRGEGGITTNWTTPGDVGPDILEWIILGKRVRFRGRKESGAAYIPIKPPSIVRVSPKKIGRIPGCIPRQKLNATHKDLWQKLAPYAPVVVIIIGAILLIIMVG